MGNDSLTASEGADRVAARGRRARLTEDEPTYSCESCSGNNFSFVTTRDMQRQVRKFLKCSCDRAEDFAASMDFIFTRTVRQVECLGSDHRMHDDDDLDADEILGEEDEELDNEIVCEYCFRRATVDDWEVEELDEWEVNEDSDHFEVRCADCDHEVEFGWSHPDRGGRVWPVESSDFNPWKSVPEERFVKDWERRGWLRPSRKR